MAGPDQVKTRTGAQYYTPLSQDSWRLMFVEGGRFRFLIEYQITGFCQITICGLGWS